MAKMNLVREFTKGIIKENPVLCLVLGTCPTLAVTTAASNAIGMGIAATIVLVCSNAVISLLRKLFRIRSAFPLTSPLSPDSSPWSQMLVKAYAPDIDKALGIYLPLIVVNCIILGRAEMYASKHSVLPSVLDAWAWVWLYRRHAGHGNYPRVFWYRRRVRRTDFPGSH